MIRRFGLLSGLLLLSAAASAALQDRDDLKRARAALRKGEYESAERMFERLAQSKPDAWEPRAGWIRVLLETGKCSGAAQVAEEFLKGYPDHPAARLALAQAALEDGDPARALGMAEKLSPGLRSRWVAARALEELDRVEEAARTAEPLVELFGKNRDEYMKDDLFALIQAVVLHARYAGRSDLYKQVVQGVLPELLQADPADAALHAFLGRLFLEKYNQAAAAGAFREALQANPNFVPAHLGMARLLLVSQETAPALRLCARALEISPSSVEARLIQAEALFIDHDPEGAIAAIDQGLQSHPRSVRLLALRSAVGHARGDAGADPDAARAMELRPNSPWPAWETARLLLLGGERQFDDAQTYFRKAVAQNGAIPQLLVDTGMNALRIGDEATARKLLEDAFAKDPFNVRVVNTVNLLHDFEKEFVVVEPPHFRVRLARSERRWEEREVQDLLARAWTDMTARYGFTPAEPLLVEVFPHHSDFSVRTMGIPGLGALGACFGRVVTTLAPRSRVRDADLGPYRWAQVLWHEMAHVFSLQVSGYRVPSWFTEGLATYEEGLGFQGGRREAPLAILLARHRGVLGGAAGLERGRATADPILSVYLQGAEICRFIAEKRGFETIVRMLRAWGGRKKTPQVFQETLGLDLEAFDREFFAWLDARLAAFKFRRPARGPVEKLLAEATAHPGDAAAAATLSLALLDSGDAAGAETYGSRAVDADGASALARAAYGQALLRRRQPREAIPHLEKGTDDFQNWDALGRSLGEVGRWHEAAAAFGRAAACFPAWCEDESGQTLYHRLNNALLEDRDTAGAFRALEKLVEIDPLDFRSRLKLARLYQEAGDLPKLGRVLEEASAVETRNLDLLDLQAALHRARREYPQATERTLAAVALVEAEGKDEEGRERAERFCAIGEDWLARGDRARALDYAGEALRLVSGLERARKLYEA
ncbi:MAG TPA: tetratricopeptide repeat protein, partial [Planctomycetota bacterium]|nr:tetratricopeptide repeat protein [Planctomycetota bacterium]